MTRLWNFAVAGLLALTVCASGPAAAKKKVQGLSYRHDEMPQGPWSAHVIKVDRSDPKLELQTTLPSGHRFALASLVEQIKTYHPDHGQVVAGINGDYYERSGPYAGDPQGLQIMRGELVSAPCDWACFWIGADGKPNIGKVDPKFQATLPNGWAVEFGLNERRADDKATLYTSVVGSSTHTSGGIELELEPISACPLPLRISEKYFARIVAVNRSGNSSTATNRIILSLGPKLLSKIGSPEVGDRVRISTATSPSLKNAQTAIGGGPTMVHAGKPAFPKRTRIRHPRSAIGWNDKFYFLVEVDGRQPDLSVGMTFEELANYMIKLGCAEAMCLDGGGSATLWTMGQVMNNPCEGEVRGTGNSLVVVSKEEP